MTTSSAQPEAVTENQPAPEAVTPAPAPIQTEPVEVVAEDDATFAAPLAVAPRRRRRASATETATGVEEIAAPVADAASTVVETVSASDPAPAAEAIQADSLTPAPRRRGRPPKAAAEAAAPRRRGRPAKAVATATTTRKPRQAAAGTDLRRALEEAIAAQGLSLPEAASAIGVALPGLRRVLSGTSRPNARTRSAYDAWLGIEGAPAAKPAAKARPAARAAAPAMGLKAAFRELRRIVEGAAAPASVVTVRAAATPKPDRTLAALAADKLAVQVHGASAKTRRVIAAALAALH